MADIRKYFTYIPNIVYNSNFPGGKYELANDFIKIHFNPSVVKDEVDIHHYKGNDSRILTSAISDDTKVTTENPLKTVLDWMVESGLRNFNCIELSDAEALILAELFSPDRSIEGIDSDLDLAITPAKPSIITFAKYVWDSSTPPKLVQTITKS